MDPQTLLHPIPLLIEVNHLVTTKLPPHEFQSPAFQDLKYKIPQFAVRAFRRCAQGLDSRLVGVELKWNKIESFKTRWLYYGHVVGGADTITTDV